MEQQGQPGIWSASTMPTQPTGVVAQQPVAFAQQPAAFVQQSLTVITVPVEQHLQQQNRRDWSSGICDCCTDCSSCCYSFWCFSCFMCSLSSKLGECACGPCCCCFPFVVAMRTKTRTMYGIAGSICDDICCVTWCGCCAMLQMWRELDSMGTHGV